MPSAACYINKVRTQADGRLNKVQYPGSVARAVNTLEASVALSPNYASLVYLPSIQCSNCKKLQ